jgi:L-alanine-DL-glutamate epimerase-like enolase superfamily enzyme
MKIVQVDTLRLDEFPNILFVQVHTDEGLTGLGETFFGARAVEAYVHETAAPYLLGTELLPDLRGRPDAHLLTSKLGGL